MESEIDWNVQFNRYLIMKKKEQYGNNSVRSLIFVELISPTKPNSVRSSTKELINNVYSFNRKVQIWQTHIRNCIFIWYLL